MIVTVEEWRDWKVNPVTKAYYEACVERMKDAEEILIGQAGLDSVNDALMRGFITAYREMLEFKIEDLENAT